MLFLDELAQEKDIEEVSLWLPEVLYAFLQSEISKSGPKNWFSKSKVGVLFERVRYIFLKQQLTGWKTFSYTNRFKKVMSTIDSRPNNKKTLLSKMHQYLVLQCMYVYTYLEITTIETQFPVLHLIACKSTSFLFSKCY